MKERTLTVRHFQLQHGKCFVIFKKKNKKPTKPKKHQKNPKTKKAPQIFFLKIIFSVATFTQPWQIHICLRSHLHSPIQSQMACLDLGHTF